MNRLIFAALICLFGWKCTTSLPLQENTAAPVQVIFVPGYYGSTLTREADGKKIWFTGAQALWGDQTLALDVDGLHIPGTTSFKVGEVLRSVDFFSSMLSKDIYGNIIDGLNTRLAGRANVVPFAYDWRGDIAISAHQLSQKVEDLYEAGASKVAILAHSMGGLVTSYYLLYGNQELNNARMDMSGARRIHGVAMAGVPFKGTQAVFRNMQYGIRFGLNAKALDGLAVASFPSSYQILPKYPRALSTLQGVDVSDWIFDAKRWRDGNWSLIKNSMAYDVATREKRMNYTSVMLSRAELLNKKLHAPSSNAESNLPFLYMYGDSIPTLHSALWHEEKRKILFPGKNIKQFLQDFDTAKLLMLGDGTITVSAGRPPKSFALIFPEMKIKKLKEEHLDLLRDEMSLNEISRFIKEAIGV